MITTSTMLQQNDHRVMITNPPIIHSKKDKDVTAKSNNYYQYDDISDNNHRPLPSVLTDFFAFKLCDFIRTKPLPIGSKRTAPELVYFILKITSQARISCHIAVVALIYIERCKAALPKNAIGDQDTIHRIFVASLLVASKYLHGTCWGRSQRIVESDHETNEADTFATSNNCSNDNKLRAEDESPLWLNNARMANICSRFYTLQQINQLELSFLNLIKFECFVNPVEVQEYLLKHRQDLLL